MAKEHERFSWEEFSRRYCETQEQTPEGLLATLHNQRDNFHPVGWMILRCEVMDSSRFGERVILPYGPKNGYKEPPDHPVSPRGLASDTSLVEGILLREDLPG